MSYWDSVTWSLDIHTTYEYLHSDLRRFGTRDRCSRSWISMGRRSMLVDIYNMFHEEAHPEHSENKITIPIKASITCHRV